MKKLLFLLLIGVVIGIGCLHSFTPGHLMFFHDTYRRLSYFPIVMGAIWFGVRGGLSLAVLSSLAFIPHLMLYVGKDPQTYLGELTEVILYLAAGLVTGIIAGRESRLREKYRQVAEKLEDSYARLHQETALLIEAEKQLGASQRLSALGQLSASLAHEIKNPLSSIRGTAEIFLDEFPVGHPKREFVEILIKEVARLNTTVEEVLKYSRGQLPEATVEKEPVAVVVERVAKLLENHRRKKAIELEILDLAAGKTFFVEGHKLAQVFLNIILNAIDVLPNQGRITVHLAAGPDWFTVAIRDNGPGIPEGERQRIFDPFYSGKAGGTGLGLSISQKIVERYGGRITCGEVPTGGACFTVFLPYPDHYQIRV